MNIQDYSNLITFMVYVNFYYFLDSEHNEECIDFTMICIFFPLYVNNFSTKNIDPIKKQQNNLVH